MRYFIYGYYGFGNFGDDLMLAAIVHHVVARDAAACITVKCRASIDGLDPRVAFLTADAILEEPKPAWLRAMRYLGAMLRSLRHHDWLIIGGGALFLDKGRISKSLILLWCLATGARMLGLRIAVIGVSCDLLANPISLWLTRSIFRKAHVITVRDQFSYDYVRYWGRADMRLCADLAFASPHLAVDSLALPSNERASHREGSGRRLLGICLVDYFAVYEPNEVRRQAFIDRMVAVLKQHSEDSDYVYISLQEGQGLGDDRMHGALAQRVVFAGYHQVRSVGEARAVCESLDGVLTMRYHLGLLAFALGARVVVLSHELKLMSLGLYPGVALNSLSQFLEDEKLDPVSDLLTWERAAPRADIEVLRRSATANFSWLG